MTTMINRINSALTGFSTKVYQKILSFEKDAEKRLTKMHLGKSHIWPSRLRAITTIKKRPKQATVEKRSRIIRWIIYHSKILEDANEDIIAGLHPKIRPILENKHLALLIFLLEHGQIRDRKIIIEILHGFHLEGLVVPSGYWPAEKRHKRRFPEKKGLFHNTKPKFRETKPSWMSPEALKQCEEGTLKELKTATISLIDKLLIRVTPSYRFSIFQKDKWRPIDPDPHNKHTFTCERMHYQDLRTLTSMSMAWMADSTGLESLFTKPPQQSSKSVHADVKRIQEGSAFAPALPKDLGHREKPLSAKEASGVWASTKCLMYILDLRNAYKEWAVDPTHQLILGFWSLVNACYLYVLSAALIFGNIHAVFVFQRISNAISEIALVLCEVVLCNYLDDMAGIEDEELAPSGIAVLRCLLRELRIPVAIKTSGYQFGDVVEFLGVDIIMMQEKIFFSVSQYKRAKTIAIFQNFLDNDSALVPEALESATGYATFIYCTAQDSLASRLLQFIHQVIAKTRWYSQEKKEFLDEDWMYDITVPETRTMLKAWISMIIKHLKHIAPRVICANVINAKPVHLWTDASTDGGSQLGALIANHPAQCSWKTRQTSAFKSNYPASLGDQRILDIAHINVLELLAVLVALYTFTNQLSNRAITLHIDNLTALFYIVRPRATRSPLSNIAALIHQRVAELNSSIWVQYVPTQFNVADAFTRSDDEYLCAVALFQPTIVQPVLPALDSWLRWLPD